MKAEDIARALGRGSERREGAGWKTLCPVHEAEGQHTPSLSVEDKNDKVVWYCRSAGCTQADITAALKALGLLNGSGNGQSGWREETANGKVWGPITRDNACAADGRVLATHCRIDLPRKKGEKKARKLVWWERDGSRGLEGLKLTELPLYGTERLAKLPDGALVVVCEGEKATKSLIERGIAAVGTVTGDSATPSDAVLTSLARYKPATWADNDDGGREHMRRIAGRLRALGNTPLKIDWKDAPKINDDAADLPAPRRICSD